MEGCAVLGSGGGLSTISCLKGGLGPPIDGSTTGSAPHWVGCYKPMTFLHSDWATGSRQAVINQCPSYTVTMSRQTFYLMPTIKI